MSKPDKAQSPNGDTFTQDCQHRIEAMLDTILPSEERHPTELHSAMRYAVLGGGKRIRPILVYASGHAVGVSKDALDYPACAVELIHAYSLIHDDLPAMDDDDYRRGKPSCHIAHGEAQAILAGDALQTLAFHILAKQKNSRLGNDVLLRMIEVLARASGAAGMVGGQAIDLASVGKQLDIAQLEDMHIRKTGALIRASVLLGVLCGTDVPAEDFERLDRFGKQIGVAFQIWDDVLNSSGNTAELGKTAGSDFDQNKPTYATMLGLETAKELAQDLYNDAISSLSPFGDNANPLRQLSEYVVNRNH